LIAADTSSIQRFLRGDRGKDVDVVATTLSDGKLVMPAVVVTELLSDPLSGPVLHDALIDAAVLVTLPGFWERAGMLRRSIRARGLKAHLAGTLIAQSCIDHNVPLITHDRDFRHFVKAGLKLL
jgi:predicted nucleic acid-binding protein